MRYIVYQLSHNWRLNCATVWVCHTAPGKYMASRNSPRGVRPNGPRIKELRKRAGFSQRDFAARFAITARTLQRAESGERVLPEMLNSIAAGLKVASSELDLEPMESSTGSTRFEPHYEQVRLPRTATARQITAVLAQVQQLTFEYDIDPDEETAEDVAAAMEIMERLVGKSGANELEPSAHVRLLGRLNSLLGRLEQQNIRVFTGSYWEPTVTIEDEPTLDRPTQYCRVETVCRGIMLIGQVDARYLTRRVIREYTDEKIDASIDELRNSGWEVDDRRTPS